jgi:cellulose synthase/poly-beta-1,6-N-acetylglucosamine synthase-like glycosyltransferase
VRCEVVVASGDGQWPDVEAPPGVTLRHLHGAGKHHYVLKNAGVNSAGGTIVVTGDGDCRPCEGFLVAVWRAFQDPDVKAVAGVSSYDGDGLLTRMHTAASMGYVHCGQEGLDRNFVLGHNVAFRREVVGRDLFGPFTGRVGGDRYLTESLRRNGHRIVLVPEMRIRHVDITFSSGGARNHMREHFLPIPYGTPARLSPAFTLASGGSSVPAHRAGRARRPLGLRLRHAPAGFFFATAFFAFFAFIVVVLSLRRRWLDFLIGTNVSPGDADSGNVGVPI